jgi:hypothetical protein
MRRILAGIVLAVMMTGGAVAEPGEVLSGGGQPCGDFVAESAQGQELYGAWALGFISGQNLMDVSDMRLTGKGWTHDSVMLWLKNYCSQHPLALFVEAAEQLRHELAAQEGLLPK